jgi:predicted AlkP superfamily phosphohydrolase/phosphomutase
MENKKTSELIDMLDTCKEGDFSTGGKYEKITGELETREAFIGIIGKDYDTSLPKTWEAINELQEEIKKLKRHKHDERTGDVMIRI